MCEATSENAGKALDRLGDQYPDPHIYLDYDSPLELLIATILAAQCTDAKVNEVTPKLWEEYPTPEDIADAEPENLHEILRPTGFYRRKTKSVQNCCRALVKKYDGDVPENLSQLTELPGVGRKTANVVLANAFDQEAIAVDTHVKRVSKI
ncbi:MAG: endonuclease III, partial [Planctomycetes bacterium]|nr:endonuclease III [Planctomycetota bacterium]